ncbi:MAG: hypothetical protein H7Y59_02405 [Anaerolineales bacterium]|nr:hypothetical protein [Anaerolineales bacterium]
MFKRIALMIFGISLFTSSCNPFSAASTPQIATQTVTLFTPAAFEISTLTPTPIGTPTIFVTKPILVEPTYTTFPGESTPIELTPVDSIIPILPNAQNVSNADWVVDVFGKRGETVSFQVDASLEDIKLFYLDELQKEGWTWIYTDYGESLVTTSPSPALFMEFRKDDTRLGVGAIGFGFFGEGTSVFVGTGYSGATLVSYYIGMIAGGLDLFGAKEEDVKQDAMLFSSTIVEFKHPSNWHVTENLMQTIDTEGAIIFFSEAGSCTVTQQPCFVNFTNLLGSQFDIPTSIRIHPEMSDLTLEEADSIRWEELKNIIPNQTYNFPENLVKPGSLESIDVRNIVLGDGASALQRTYKWKAEAIQESVIPETFISTYTLFMSAGLLVEFHADFTNEEWSVEKSNIDQMISGIITIP